MVSRSRNQLADFQAAEARKKHAEDQYKQQQRIQAEQRELLAQAMAMVPRQQPRKPKEKSPLQQQFESGEPFTSKADWLQFAHEKRLEYYQILKTRGQQAADVFEQAIQDQAVQNIIGPHALRHKDGYIIVGNQAVGTAEAEKKAREFVEYVVEHEEYPPLQYPTNPNLPKSAYPDVTDKVDGLMNKRAEFVKGLYYDEGKALGIVQGNGVYALFKSNFGNNEPFDLQVNHELPGQVVPTDNILFHPDGTAQTVDQYALYQGNIVRAGYLSNYAYGYLSAAGRLSLEESLFDAWFIGDSGYNLSEDNNKKDNDAIKDGYNSYWKQHPNERRPIWPSDYL